MCVPQFALTLSRHNPRALSSVLSQSPSATAETEKSSAAKERASDFKSFKRWSSSRSRSRARSVRSDGDGYTSGGLTDHEVRSTRGRQDTRASSAKKSQIDSGVLLKQRSKVRSHTPTGWGTSDELAVPSMKPPALLL